MHILLISLYIKYTWSKKVIKTMTNTSYSIENSDIFSFCYHYGVCTFYYYLFYGILKRKCPWAHQGQYTRVLCIYMFMT